MLNYNLPLTEAESEFAAEHHSVIYGYLRKAGLPEDDFYDVVVFGYLRAVRKYLARPELRKYSFSTIAYRAMSCDVHHSKEYWMRKKRRALVESLDEELHTRDLLDPVSAAYENVLSFQELSGKLTQKQPHCAHRATTTWRLPVCFRSNPVKSSWRWTRRARRSCRSPRKPPHLRLKFRRYPMSNMSYCRFQNTYGDAAECLDALEQQKELSGDEYNAARNMFLEFLRFCVDMEIIEDFDKERFGEYLGELRTGRD